jgi:hypothetical protein
MNLSGHKCFICRKGTLGTYASGALHQSGNQFKPTTIFQCSDGECKAATWAANHDPVWQTFPRTEDGGFKLVGTYLREMDLE